MLEPGPWPQMKPTSSPSGSSLSVIDWISVAWSAAGHVGAADRAVEQHVADMGEAHVLVEEHHAARRMAGAMQDVEGQLADRDLVAFVEPAVRREIAHAGHAEARAARHHIVEQELVGDMRALDRHLQRVAQFGGAADMVDMAMGQPDLFDRDIGLLDRRLDLRHVAAGIDHHGLLGGLAPQQRAVLLEQGHRDDGGAGFRLGFGLSVCVMAAQCRFLARRQGENMRLAIAGRRRSTTSALRSLASAGRRL